MEKVVVQKRPVNISEAPFYPSLEEVVSPKAIVREWLNNKNLYCIDDTPFVDYIKPYRLDKPDSFQDTKLCRLYKFFDEQLLQYILAANEAQFESTKDPAVDERAVNFAGSEICRNDVMDQLRQNQLMFCWGNTLLRRFTSRNYKLSGGFEHQLNFKKLDNHLIGLHHQFSYIGTSVWHDPDFDPKSIDEKPTIPIVESPEKIFSGESLVLLYAENKQLHYSFKRAKATLFAAEMRRPFVQMALDEQINEHLTEKKNEISDVEKTILLATKQYYLGYIDHRALQTAFISNQFYDKEFAQSKTFRLVQHVLDEKPYPKSDNPDLDI
jgi:hypothetical protein